VQSKRLACRERGGRPRHRGTPFAQGWLRSSLSIATELDRGDAISWLTLKHLDAQGPGKVAIRPYLSDSPTVVGRRHATALVQARSQIPATGMFGHLVHTATLPEPCLDATLLAISAIARLSMSPHCADE
jgi:hypothetical protein